MRFSILVFGLAWTVALALPGAAEVGAPEAGAPKGEAAPAPPPASRPSAAAPAPAAKHGVSLGPVVKDAQGREGRMHVVQSGETLWEISDAYLGTPWVWPSLWRENGDIQDPDRIFPGDKLFVNASEMRRLSADEAARMLAGGSDAPAALADGMESGRTAQPRSYRFTPIETAGFVSVEEFGGAAAIVDSTKERVWLGDHDEVIVGLGEGETQVGARYDIFRTTNTVGDPETHVPVGYAILALGWLEITEVHAESSLASIELSTGEIRRGDRVLPRVQSASEIPIVAKPAIDGRVVYTWADRLWMGEHDLVYLNRGADDGLEVGSPLEVYRPIGEAFDGAQGRDRKLPDDVVAKLLVVATTPETATALVTHSAAEITNGDHFRGADSLY